MATSHRSHASYTWISRQHFFSVLIYITYIHLIRNFFSGWIYKENNEAHTTRDWFYHFWIYSPTFGFRIPFQRKVHATFRFESNSNIFFFLCPINYASFYFVTLIHMFLHHQTSRTKNVWKIEKNSIFWMRDNVSPLMSVSRSINGGGDV